MNGAKHLHAASEESYYYSFRTNYFEAETRRLNAITLIPGNPAREQDWQYPTRTVLAAQWNDSIKQGLETARVLYSLEPTLNHYLGQSVLKLTGISTPEVKALREGNELPPFGCSIDIGVINQGTRPEYGFRKTPKRCLPTDVNPNGAFLDFQVSLPVTAGPSIEVSGDGKIEIHESFRDTTDFTAYSGRVSLESDQTLYARTRQTEVGNLVFGNNRSFGIVYELLKATGGPQFEAFQEQFEHDKISPFQPLTALDSIAD
jgi:hypothetical protein